MNISKYRPLDIVKSTTWQVRCLLLSIISLLALIFSFEPIMQSTQYHFFSDSRQLTLIPNFFDVVSNLPFFIIGVSGCMHCNSPSSNHCNNAWLIMFIGVALVSLGSAYYHWQPSYDSLFWDRLPMTIAFMALFVAIICECINEKLFSSLLLPTILLGGSSVVYWYITNDLRFYIWIQAAPLATIPTIMLLFKSKYSHQWLLVLALAFYILAKITELYDMQIFQWTYEILSGHSMKHLLASASCYCILLMLQRRSIKLV